MSSDKTAWLMTVPPESQGHYIAGHLGMRRVTEESKSIIMIDYGGRFMEAWNRGSPHPNVETENGT
jgi:ribosomal protein L3